MSTLNLSGRDKKAILICAAFLVLFFGFRLVVAPVFDNKANLEQAIVTKRAAVQQMQQQMDQFKTSSSKSNEEILRQIKQRPTGFSLFSFLDLQIQQSGVKEKVDYMKPQTRTSQDPDFTVASVKIQLKQVYLKELVTFLNRVEMSGKGVFITSLSLSKAGKSKDMLDAVLEAQTLVPSKAESRGVVRR